jgi:two-component system LytT family response regulator
MASTPEHGCAYLQRIRVRGADRIRVIATADIDWVRAKGGYTHIHVGGAVYLHPETLRHLLGELDPERFLRIHRRTLVNLERIREVRAQLQGNTEVLLQNGTRLALSRRFRIRVRNALAARSVVCCDWTVSAVTQRARLEKSADD